MTIVRAMGAVIKLDECYDDTSGGTSGPHTRAVNSHGGGNVDDILNRLGALETAVLDLYKQVSGIAATIPHLATKADLNSVRVGIGAVQGSISALETRLIRWMIATALASAGLVSAIAKFLH
jgi:hypothetical protein